MRKTHLTVLACIALVAPTAMAEPKRPNILFILADDQRNDTLGCAGHPIVQTPHIDRLAEQGVRFCNAFVTTSVCMASRASIFTGLTEAGHGYTGGPAPATPVIEADVDTSFPVLLRKAGYRLGFFGKQHVKFQEGKQPALARMFDEHEVIMRRPYVRYYEQDPVYECLYDLETDPDQFSNLALNPEHQTALSKLRDRCAAYVQAYTRPDVVAVKQEQAKKTRKENN